MYKNNGSEKYYYQRYRLFSKFDEGIRIEDEESWYSVTPEAIGKRIAEKCCKKDSTTVLDAFCGIGGNAIQFALMEKCTKVVAVEIDESKIDQARHNARIYGVEHKIEFICGDFFKFVQHIKDNYSIDVCFLSPPWGGPEYNQERFYSLNQIEPLNGFELFMIAKSITENIVYFLPRNTNIQEFFALVNEDESFDIEQNFLNKKLKTISVYFGKLLLN